MSPHEADDVTQRSLLGHVACVEDTADELDLLHVISHEFRTPLTVLLTGVDVLRQQVDLDGDLLRVLEAMTRASRRLDRLVGQAAAAVDVDHARVAVRLGDVLDDVFDALDAHQRERCFVAVSEELRSRIVQATATRRVLECLVDNALTFSPDGLPVVVRGVLERGEIVLRVADRGPGIDAAFRDAAFDAFRQRDMRTAREHGGLGIGLFAARRWAWEAGGELVLEDSDSGTVAALRLPSEIDLTEDVPGG